MSFDICTRNVNADDDDMMVLCVPGGDGNQVGGAGQAENGNRQGSSSRTGRAGTVSEGVRAGVVGAGTASWSTRLSNSLLRLRLRQAGSSSSLYSSSSFKFLLLLLLLLLFCACFGCDKMSYRFHSLACLLSPTSSSPSCCLLRHD